MLNILEQEIIDCGGIESYLYTQQNKTLLRFLTCGSVDDGKSTLIGRLLHDTQHVYDDQLCNLYSDNDQFGVHKDKIDLSLLVDGLQLERMQGITIDVSYRYFSSKKRKFIIVDTPGHEEYTRNMVTGASNSNLAVLLVDACKGIRKQTKRHLFISFLMGIRTIIVVVNKMDLVNYDEKIFQDITIKCLKINSYLSESINMKFIPISALDGDNVIQLSKNMSWYDGPTLFNILDDIKINFVTDINDQKLRLPIQYIIRDHFNFRGYSGTIASGSLHKGQQIRVFPSNITSYIKQILNCDKNQTNALTGEAVTITLTDDIDVSKGDILIDSKEKINFVESVVIDVIWMKKDALKKGQYFDVKITTKFYRVQIKDIYYQIDMHTFIHQQSDEIPYNGIGVIELLFEEPVILDEYLKYPVTGSMIFIDILSNDTVGAGMVKNSKIHQVDELNNKKYSEFELALHELIQFHFPHWNVPDLT
ncbi:sulfate adenylyltransferase subunit 1 [Candidatus Blochmanniella vafra str. BVAF]|uniref:sulfate adenylyltransferase n=1 Tax=Blochmanniella vafra (strain BVAF) TaxID=859654 RepID=E8Q5S4_BLOVB|nr:sulfate adenylyltransferase subunit CysN [Candidatus Blochmannia vafer]ADV33571.1 sulfate adenylyltransferase subunit 1 [Candidatus Blochmannia vafer str. BVAF]